METMGATIADRTQIMLDSIKPYNKGCFTCEYHTTSDRVGDVPELRARYIPIPCSAQHKHVPCRINCPLYKMDECWAGKKRD